MPIFADRILHSGAEGLGILMCANGLGALAGALLMASRTGLKGFTRWIPSAAALFALSLAGFTGSSRLWLSCAMLFIAGFALMIQVGASNTLIQSIVPDHLRGRTMSVYSMMYIGVGPLGAMAAGFAADSFGVRLTLFTGAVVCAVASGVFALYVPSLRPIVRELIRDRDKPTLQPVAQAAEGPENVSLV
jgi:MFS family permease